MRPRPSALRLVRAPGARGAPPAAPFGGAFDDEATSLALEHAGDDEPLAALADRLPHAASLTSDATVVFLPPRRPGLVARMFGGRTAGGPLLRATQASALLARGYAVIAIESDDATGEALVVGHAHA